MINQSCCQLLQNKLGGENRHYSTTQSVFKEQGKEVRLTNLRKQKPYCLVHLEEVMKTKEIPSERKTKPDILVKVCDENRFYLVELKGNGIPAKDAMNQIISGIQYAKHKGVSLPRASIYGVIVGSRMPSSLAWNDLQTKFRKHGRNLIRKESKYEIPLNH